MDAKPKYTDLPHWCAISGMKRTATYYALGRGNLRAIKLGKRTLIDVDHGLTWMASLPAAQVTAPRKAA